MNSLHFGASMHFDQMLVINFCYRDDDSRRDEILHGRGNIKVDTDDQPDTKENVSNNNVIKTIQYAIQPRILKEDLCATKTCIGNKR